MTEESMVRSLKSSFLVAYTMWYGLCHAPHYIHLLVHQYNGASIADGDDSIWWFTTLVVEEEGFSSKTT
jgi:hypothetical protein